MTDPRHAQPRTPPTDVPFLRPDPAECCTKYRLPGPSARAASTSRVTARHWW